jgi:hypothetical protein
MWRIVEKLCVNRRHIFNLNLLQKNFVSNLETEDLNIGSKYFWFQCTFDFFYFRGQVPGIKVSQISVC